MWQMKIIMEIYSKILYNSWRMVYRKGRSSKRMARAHAYDIEELIQDVM